MGFKCYQSITTFLKCIAKRCDEKKNKGAGYWELFSSFCLFESHNFNFIMAYWCHNICVCILWMNIFVFTILFSHDGRKEAKVLFFLDNHREREKLKNPLNIIPNNPLIFNF